MKPSRAALNELEIFRGLSPDEVAALEDRLQVRHCRDNDLIFLRGDPGHCAFVVLSGMVRISSSGENGKRVTVEIFRRGQIFGEMAILDDHPRAADANAIGPTEVAAVPAREFLELLSVSPAFSVNLLKLMTGRLRRTYSLLEDAALTDLERRLAKQIIYLIRLGASGEQCVKLYTRLRQSDLADLLGATPRSIINIFNKWRAEELADFNGRTAQVTILDFDRFQVLAESPLAERKRVSE